MSRRLTLSLIGLSLFLLAGCSNTGSNKRLQFSEKGREVPAFHSDSAYHFIKQQVAFGYRNPGSEGHRATRNYLRNKLESYAGERNVFAQNFTHIGYEGDTLHLTNLIAAFNTEASDRIMLCAHWDTRPRAENADEDTGKPILGADDGGSGVGVLLELARIFSRHSPPIGVDIILFDGEDYGKEGDSNQYFLGSRYWSDNPPVPGYRPRFAILLDMVGGRDALFPIERNSYQIAPGLVEEVWGIAAEKGFDSLFTDRMGSAISDDHVVINRITGIPIIDIIHHYPTSGSRIRFAPYWHTHQDDMENIARATLQSVGTVLNEVIFNRL